MNIDYDEYFWNTFFFFFFLAGLLFAADIFSLYVAVLER